MTNTTTVVGGWIKAVFMQDGQLPTVADCCRLAALVEHALVFKDALDAERKAHETGKDQLQLCRELRRHHSDRRKEAEARVEELEKAIKEKSLSLCSSCEWFFDDVI